MIFYTKREGWKIFCRAEKEIEMDISGLPLYVVYLSGSGKDSNPFACILADQRCAAPVEIVY